MIDSTRSASCKESKAERPKPTVPKSPSTRRPRWTPTSTLSARVIYCTADDLLPEARANARRRITRRRGGHALRGPGDHGHPHRPPLPRDGEEAPRPPLPRAAQPARLLEAPAPARRRDRVAHGRVRLPRARASRDDLLLVDSTPVPCAASRETVKRSALADAAGYGYCAAHSRLLLGPAPAPARRARRHAARARAGRSRPRRARGRARAARARPCASGRGAGLRQGLRRARVRRRSR